MNQKKKKETESRNIVNCVSVPFINSCRIISDQGDVRVVDLKHDGDYMVIKVEILDE